MKYKIWENQNTLVFEGEIPKDEVVDLATKLHLANPDRYHEIYRFQSDWGKWIGIAQWKPGDCEHHWPKSECPSCQTSGADTP